jgi:hypothetical protein
MDISTLAKNIRNTESRNLSIELLEAIVVDQDQLLVDSLCSVIMEPSSINNTNRFASLLVDYSSEKYLKNLVETISGADLNNSPWLADYMYALGRLLDELELEYETTDDFVHLLGNWLLSTGGGEISWKASHILAWIKNNAALPYLLAGAENNDLFHQTRIACIRGVVNNFRPHAKKTT